MNTYHYNVAIIGAGFSGLGMAMALQEAGERDFVIFEKNAGLGGVWWENTYPGAACDVQSHLYSYSFELNSGWSRFFAAQSEIQTYLEACAKKYGLAPHVRLDTGIVRLVWNEADSLWHVTDSNGAAYTARYVVSARGALTVPRMPELAGLGSFQGKLFHSQNWDHDYDLSGKRVAVIGTGASAIQFIPHLQRKVAVLDIYQRTAPWILPKGDRAISLGRQSLFAQAPQKMRTFRNKIFRARELNAIGFNWLPFVLGFFKRAAEKHLRQSIADPELKAKLTPNYAIGCKRILLSDDYYPTVAQPNVNLITDPIAEITPEGIRTADGSVHPADAIILGTGFDIQNLVPPNFIIGRADEDLADVWAEGQAAYKGTMVPGFPNLFFMLGPNTGLAHNSVIYMIEAQIAYVMEILKALRQRQKTVIEVRQDFHNAWNARLQRRLSTTVWLHGGCASWYLHPKNRRNVTLWPGFSWSFKRALRRFDQGAYDLDR